MSETVDPPSGPPDRTLNASLSSDPNPSVSNHTNSNNPTGSSGVSAEPIIDPELASLPAPPRSTSNSYAPIKPKPAPSSTTPIAAGSITESILSAPNPRPTDFNPNFEDINMEIDIGAIQVDEDAPGSPTAKVMRAIAPPNAVQIDQKWAAPPPNASVNLFIGRALLSNGNDNWPLKPNDIVSWIRKNYPSEWDGDEGRCSAHRVRTYLARKGADMYYEKLNQGCIAGWRIRQNHLWRFENGGFQGRGMKQEEAIAAAQKESEMIATAAHKAAAAEALAAGHPGVKTSMSLPGIDSGLPSAKRARTKAAGGQARRRSTKKEPDETPYSAYLDTTHLSHLSQPDYATLQHSAQGPSTAGPSDQSHSGLGVDGAQHHTHTHDPNQMTLDPALGADGLNGADEQVDMNLVHQAMQAAAAAGAGQIDDLDMGMQLPIEMQMHGGDHENEDEARYRTGTGYYSDQSTYPGQFGGNFYGQTYGYQHTQGQ